MRKSRGALERALDILFLLDSERRPLDVAGIASRLHVPESSVYRILRVLRNRGLVERDPNGPGCRPGSVFLRWGSRVQARDDVVKLAGPVLRSLATQTGETAHLELLHGSQAITVDLAESPSPVRVAPERGHLFPLHCGAAAKAILAHLPESRWRELIDAGPLASFTRKTITDPARLRADLEATRARGYALSEEELYEGGRAVAAPIFDASGAVCGSLAISGPLHRFGDDRRKRAAVLTKREAKRLSDMLGYRDAKGGKRRRR
jgi:DNA-binding IclR family transcriptional regulator